MEKELCDAVQQNDLGSLKTLLNKDEVKRNGNLGRNEWTSGEDPFHFAASLGRDEMIHLMKDSGFDVNSYSVDGDVSRSTALHWAVLKDQQLTLKLLLDLGADKTLKGSGLVFSGPALARVMSVGMRVVRGADWKWAEEDGNGEGEVVKELDTQKEISVKWANGNSQQYRMGAEEKFDLRVAKVADGSPLELASQFGRTDVARMMETHKTKPASLTSFATLDSMAKIMQKAQKEKDVEEGLKFQTEISAKKAQVTKLQSEILRKEEELKNDQIKLEALKMEVTKLEKEPNFQFLDEIKGHLNEIEDISKTLKGILLPDKHRNPDRNTCPICFMSPQQVFCCQECDQWVCQDCQSQLKTCPQCRQDLVAKPLTRNRALERVFRES